MSKAKPLIGEIRLPGDKSLSHRSAMFSTIAKGVSKIKNISDGGDVASTIKCLEILGARYKFDEDELEIHGDGLHSLSGANEILDCGNSGTTLRLLTGLLSGQDLENVSLVGDESLSKRPHNRVIEPLNQMGIDITGREGSYTPLIINSSQAHSCEIDMSIDSAQVKSAILLAGLYADGPVSVIEHHPTRNHTENMLRYMGVSVSNQQHINGTKITVIPPTSPLKPLNATIPSDPSSAAFFGVAACLIEDSDIVIKDVLLNSTRIAWIDALRSMGANIETQETNQVFGEKVGDVSIKASKLHATTIAGSIIASLIDELPILSLAMSCAQGQSTVKDAQELRVKESDRISVVVDHLNRAGITASELPDGYLIQGSTIKNVDIRPGGDHRIAMTFAIANYISTGNLVQSNQDVISTSFPRFYQLFASLIST